METSSNVSILSRIDPMLIATSTRMLQGDLDMRRFYLMPFVCKYLGKNQTQQRQAMSFFAVTQKMMQQSKEHFVTCFFSLLSETPDTAVDDDLINILEQSLIYLNFGNDFFERICKDEYLEKADKFAYDYKIKLLKNNYE